MARTSPTSFSQESDNWIAGAVKRPGAFKKKAKAAGMGTQAFAKKNDKGNSRTAKQARLAETFAKMRGK